MANSAHVLLNVFLLPLLTRLFSPPQYGIIELINTTMIIHTKNIRNVRVHALVGEDAEVP